MQLRNWQIKFPFLALCFALILLWCPHLLIKIPFIKFVTYKSNFSADAPTKTKIVTEIDIFYSGRPPSWIWKPRNEFEELAICRGKIFAFDNRQHENSWKRQLSVNRYNTKTKHGTVKHLITPGNVQFFILSTFTWFSYIP